MLRPMAWVWTAIRTPCCLARSSMPARDGTWVAITQPAAPPARPSHLVIEWSGVVGARISR